MGAVNTITFVDENPDLLYIQNYLKSSLQDLKLFYHCLKLLTSKEHEKKEARIIRIYNKLFCSCIYTVPCVPLDLKRRNYNIFTHSSKSDKINQEYENAKTNNVSDKKVSFLVKSGVDFQEAYDFVHGK